MKRLISCVVIFGVIFDSGGGLGIRSGALIVLFIFTMLASIKTARGINNRAFIAMLAIYAIAIMGQIIALLNGVSFSATLKYSFAFYSLLFFLIAANNGYLSISSYCDAAIIFSLIIIIFFLSRLFAFVPIVRVFESITLKANGMFNTKVFSNSSSILPNVYFQGTLALIPAGVFLISMKKNISFLICLVALAVAPSRFGFLVLIVFLLIVRGRRLFLVAFLLIAIYLLIRVSSIEIPAIIDLNELFSVNSYDNIVRRNHIESLFSLFNENPMYLLIGQGPGSYYFTTGYNAFVDSIEISQVDLLRRYGIVVFGILNSLFFGFLIKLSKYYGSRQRGFSMALLAHYIVSFSNPVLLSLPAMIFISASISEYDYEKTIKALTPFEST